MSTINDLSSTSTVSPDDQIPIWQNANGVTRKMAVSVLDSRYLTQADIALLAASAVTETFVAGIGFTPGTTLALTLANQYYSTANIEIFFDAAFQGPDQYTLVGFGLVFTSPIPVGTQRVYIRGGAVRVIAAPSAGTVSDQSLLLGSKVYNRTKYVTYADDFGSPSATTLATAVSTMKAAGGGVLYVPNVAFQAFALPADYHGVLLESDGPNIPGTQGGEPPGTNFICQKMFQYQDNTAHLGFGHSILHVQSNPIGTGTIGPNNADFAITISLLKQNWGGAASAGELDGMNIIVRNGGNNSDTTGFLINVGNAGIGFNALFEGVTNAGGKGLDVQCGVVDSRSGLEYGIVLAAFQGQCNTGILIQADGVAGAWTDFIQCIQKGVMSFRLDANGVVHMRDPLSTDVQSEINFHVGNGTMGWANNAGSSIMTLDQTGDLSLSGFMNGAAYKVGSVQVVGSQISGYGVPTGPSKLANFPGASATLVQCSAQIAQIIADLKTHGLLAT